MNDKELKEKVVKTDPNFEKKKQQRDKLEYTRQAPKYKKFDYTQINKEKK